MYNSVTKLFLLLASFSPLAFFYLALQAYRLAVGSVAIAALDWKMVALVASAILFCCIGYRILSLNDFKTLSFTYVITVTAAPDETTNLSYLSTYIIPFLILLTGQPSDKEGVALGLYFCLLAYVFARTSLFAGNPLSWFAGYNLFKITVDTGRTYTVLTKSEDIKAGARLKLITLANHVAVAQA